jgi:NADH:ubiquinone oxidoreductase subunit H
MNPEPMNKKMYKLNLDFFSIAVSVLCAVHCIMLPIVFSTLPLWGMEVLENRYIELGSVLLTLLAGGEAIRKGYMRCHRSLSVVVLFLGGFALMTLANFVEAPAGEMLMKGAGALFVVSAHLTNWVKCKACGAS